MADWNQLPDDALGSALSFLNEMDGRVLVLAAPCMSKGWRQACERLRARIDLSDEWASSFTDAGLESIIRRFPQAVSISLSLDEDILQTLGLRACQLSAFSCAHWTSPGVIK